MFCPNCGHEVFGDAPFCSRCGKPVTVANQPLGAPASLGPAPPPPRPAPALTRPRGRGRLWNHHTFDWTGECPACHDIHTAETSLCPNEGSPLVVGFKGWRWNPFSFAIETAHLQCSNNCGFTSDATSCLRDGTIIKGWFIRFRTSMVRAFLYNLLFMLAITFFLLPLFYFLYCVESNFGFRNLWAGKLNPVDHKIWEYVYFTVGFIVVGCPTALGLSLAWVWKFRMNFDFDRVARGAESLQKWERMHPHR